MSKFVEVKYTAEQFIKASFGEGICFAREYVKSHPKESYGADDFAEVYRMRENANRERYPNLISHGEYTKGWFEDDNSFNTAVKLYEEGYLG